MAFPTTGILDNFNRDNEGPPPSGNWTTLADGLKVVSNQCAGDTINDNNMAYWNVETFGPACECYATYPTAAHAGFVVARFATATWNGYYVMIDIVPDEVTINRLDGGSGTQLGAAIDQALASGDKWGIECDGDQISAYFDDGGAGWGLLGTRTDGTHTDANYVGLLIFSTTDRADDFGGGTVVPPPTGQPFVFRTFGIPTGAGVRHRPGGWN